MKTLMKIDPLAAGARCRAAGVRLDFISAALFTRPRASARRPFMSVRHKF